VAAALRLISGYLLRRSRTAEALRLRMEIIHWHFDGKTETLAAMAQRLRVSRRRLEQIAREEIRNFVANPE